ncbi:MAG TPA: hypothetical protein GX710_00885, partial [Clostridiales bacterium]|nr:hypothetical protein [Clostridiales bacterium]
AWGSSIKDLEKKYPDIEETTDNEDRQYNHRVFQVSLGNYFRVFFYFDDKLYTGRTVYKNVDETFTLALMTKVVEEYGKFTDFGESEKSDSDYYWFEISITKNFSVMIEAYEYVDNLGRITSNMVFITYSDDVVWNKVRAYEIEQKKKVIEL